MKHFSAVILRSCLSASTANARSYCSPTFVFGCTNWHSQSISIGQIDWTYDGVDRPASDFTALSTTVNAGNYPNMTVTTGVWCGCAVWMDFDNSDSFEDNENLYYSYVGGDPGYTYDFTLAIPASLPTGAYRTRVVAPWGSDGFLTSNTNGYGACGDYQYGNFTDLTLNVIGVTGIADQNTSDAPLVASPNPTGGLLTLATDGTLERITVWSADGRAVPEQVFNTRSQNVQLDLSTLPVGVYQVQCLSGATSRTVRVAKQ